MGRRSRAGAIVVSALLAAGPAAAEPFVSLPPLGAGHLLGDGVSRTAVTMLVDVDMLGVLAAERLAVWPDRQFGLEPATPALARARVGLRVDFCAAPASLVVRADAAEMLRSGLGASRDETFEAFVGLEPGAIVGAVLDDLYVYAEPSRFALVAGRTRVPFSRARQVEETELPMGTVPFVVDRIVPDRRWGVAVMREHGPLTTMAGAFEDVEELEPDARADDGTALGVLGVAWEGSLAVQANGLVRDDSGWILLSAGGQAGPVRWMAEGLGGRESGDWTLGGWGAGAVDIGGPLAAGLSAEWDGGDGEGRATFAARIAYRVRGDAANEISVMGWVSREEHAPHDAVVLLLRATL